jgi:hypothetical protein
LPASWTYFNTTGWNEKTLSPRGSTVISIQLLSALALNADRMPALFSLGGKSRDSHKIQSFSEDNADASVGG